MLGLCDSDLLNWQPGLQLYKVPKPFTDGTFGKKARPASLLWAVQETGVLQLVVDDVITESLEADNLVLQNMSSSKYVQARLPLFTASALFT